MKRKLASALTVFVTLSAALAAPRAAQAQTAPAEAPAASAEKKDTPAPSESSDARLTITVKGLAEGAVPRITIDGVEVPEGSAARHVEPGDHVIEVSADGYLSVRQTVSVARSASAKVEALLFPADPQAGTEAGAADAGKKVPASVTAMVKRRVVLRTTAAEPLTGRLLAADEGGFSIEREDRSIIVVPRNAARGIRLADAPSAPVAPAAAPQANSAPAKSEPVHDFAGSNPSLSNDALKVGSGLLGAAWGAAIGVAGSRIGEERESKRDGWLPLFVPIAGPFIAIETLESEGAGTALLVIDGSLQSLGLLMIVVGAVTQGSDDRRPSRTASGVSVTPVFTGNGFGVAGTF